MEGKWFAQLATRKQQVNEDVDTYHSAVQELLQRIETGAQPYPDTAKVQLFLNGLRPDIVLAVALFTPNTLQAAYERAKAYESACKQSLPYLPTSISALYSSQSVMGIPVGLPPSVSTSESAIES